jgi:hypothetical protein
VKHATANTVTENAKIIAAFIPEQPDAGQRGVKRV